MPKRYGESTNLLVGDELREDLASAQPARNVNCVFRICPSGRHTFERKETGGPEEPSANERDGNVQEGLRV